MIWNIARWTDVTAMCNKDVARAKVIYLVSYNL